MRNAGSPIVAGPVLYAAEPLAGLLAGAGLVGSTGFASFASFACFAELVGSAGSKDWND